MKVRKILEEKQIGAQVQTIKHGCNSLDQVAAALDRLDGKKITSVGFWISDDAVLNVGGDGKDFVVFLAFKVDEKLCTLTDPTKPGDSYRNVVTGGQLGSYPSNLCVDKDMAKEAVSYFCVHGSAAPHLTWLCE